MKRQLYILLVCALFVACKSDDDIEHPLSDRVSKIEIITSFDQGGSVSDKKFDATTVTYSFEYDEQGRVTKVNDRIFFYDGTGRVSHSIVERKMEDEHYVEQLRYYWEGQGRLREVRLDLYQRYEANGEMYHESLVEDFLLATFDYSPYHQKPYIIEYSQLIKEQDSRIVSLDVHKRVTHLYDGDGNLGEIRFIGYEITPFPSDEEASFYTWPYARRVSPTYLEGPHYLAKIYAQLGFHPYRLEEVVGANSIATTRVEITQDGDVRSEWTPSAWREFAGNRFELGGYSPAVYNYYLNALELPTEIIIESNGITQHTLITYE